MNANVDLPPPQADTRLGIIDCDVHPAPRDIAAILPFMDEFWRAQVKLRGIDRVALSEVFFIQLNFELTFQHHPLLGKGRGFLFLRETRLQGTLQFSFEVHAPLQGGRPLGVAGGAVAADQFVERAEQVARLRVHERLRRVPIE